MGDVSRRDALCLTTAAGLVAAGAAVVRADDKKDEKKPTAKELFERLKLTGEKRRPAEVFAARGDPPVLLVPPNGSRAIEPVNSVAEVRRLEDGRGRLLTYGLSWTLAADKFHNLYIDATTPLRAKSITFEYTNISWQAGDGWPVYHVRCPRDDYGQNFYYTHAKIHAIVHSIGNTYSISCLQSGIFTVNGPDQVRCAVNDGPGDYGDNRGTWDITISSWS
jgi:hypothetical protein